MQIFKNENFVSPNAPNFLLWVFIGPMIGALSRPVGGWLADKMGGAILTQGVAIFSASMKSSAIDTPGS